MPQGRINKKEFKLKQELWLANDKHTWLVNVDPNAARFISVLEKAPKRLEDFCTVNQGLRTGDNAKYLAESDRGRKWERAAGGAEVHRYMPIQDGLWVYYEPAELDAPRKRELFDREEKIVVQEIRNITLDRRIVATLDKKRTFCLQSTNVVGLKENAQVDIRFIMGVISSTLMNKYFRLRFPANNHIASNQLASLPIPLPTKAEETRIAALVDRLLATTERLNTAHAEHEKVALAKVQDALDEQIERMVCNLFGVQFQEAAG